MSSFKWFSSWKYDQKVIEDLVYRLAGHDNEKYF